MKTHNHATPKFTDDFPLLPWDRQKAIMDFFLYGPADKDNPREMSGAEQRFYYAMMDLIDAYGQAPDARYREILRAKPISG
jgi:hypothetical protein